MLVSDLPKASAAEPYQPTGQPAGANQCQLVTVMQTGQADDETQCQMTQNARRSDATPCQKRRPNVSQCPPKKPMRPV